MEEQSTVNVVRETGKPLVVSTRHRRQTKYCDTVLQGLSKSAIRRLARRGGVKRISGMVYDETRNALRGFLTSLIHDATMYTTCAARRTVTARDVCHALKRKGKILYGFGV